MLVAEALTGLSTIRAYRGQQTSIKSTELGLDLENRAYYLTLSVASWLGVRLNFLGSLLALGVALFAVGFRTSVEPSKTGIVLTYALSSTSLVYSQPYC